MKKFFSLMVIAALSVSMVGCGEKPKTDPKADPKAAPATPEPAKDATPPAK